MGVRERIDELTTGITTQVELDSFVSRNGGLIGVFAKVVEVVPDAARDEFMYEWENRKLRIKKMTRFD